MSEVSRYEPRNKLDEETGLNQMQESKVGDWVLFEAFELATKARDGVFSEIVNSLTAERDQWEKHWKESNFQNTKYLIERNEAISANIEMAIALELIANHLGFTGSAIELAHAIEQNIMDCALGLEE